VNPRTSYPPDYREEEVNRIISALRTGECVSVVGLSGSGKSNLLAYLTGQRPDGNPTFVMVDCNRLEECSIPSLFRLIYRSLGGPGEPRGLLEEIQGAITNCLERLPAGVCLLFDRFDILALGSLLALYSNLRALRDEFKYTLTYLTATRRPLDSATELAELFYAHTMWLGPLNARDARWSVLLYADRAGMAWDEAAIHSLISLSSGYPALLRAACEAYAAGCSLQVEALSAYPGVQWRVAEFWADEPSEDALRLSGLLGQPLLIAGRPGPRINPTQEDSELTAKEHMLLAYFYDHPEVVCEKDNLIRAVWPEDHIFEQGIRDDSLAQLVRRLRTKIEADPSQPRHIHTVPGRGYRYTP
jgi:energy-coupling factor transporter ATP-binding protein EcfA2